ncbi:histidine-containing phosphotransfer protein 2-like [Triticum dicoccoides]|uniref:histidine-containing phosphotransfer protein 2-like n=1 Tax=Triticum dicoccoides TaxID=85692 RepID=UPI00189023DB|nr:histidine-containing phosphotransfer protein 2-like [Triticum dicoccoides]
MAYSVGIVSRFMEAPTMEHWAAVEIILRNLPDVDFDMVRELVHQLKGTSCSVAAKKVNLSCVHFCQFYEAKCKEGCRMALNLLRNEFYDVRDKLETIMQLEQQIAALGPK